ncbi:MAG: 4a-hydroxytetrahydrobiopterin dehydratase [Dehalococcoidia bacterium]|jgi:4a-hydroxytetrahydrobiopterin dehydratase
MSLADEKSHPIAAGEQPLPGDEAKTLARDVPGWTLVDGRIEEDLRFADFGQAIEFVNRVAGVAAREDHHPDILISYNRVRLILSTHKIGGLSRNDFIVAAKIDRLL